MQILKHLSAFFFWNLGVSAAIFLLAPLLGLALALLLTAWVLWGYLLGLAAGGPARRWAALRLRPLGPEALRWTLIGTPVLLTLSWSLGQVYVQLVPVPPGTLNPFEALLDTPVRRLTLALLAVGIAPIVEEFFFRGLIQRALERRLGPGYGIVGSAAVFAAIHLLPWILPLHFFLGLAFGFAVYATRSIWAGVLLHAANNAVAMLGTGLQGPEEVTTPTLWEVGPTLEWWVSLVVLLVAAAVGVWIGRRMWEAGRGAGAYA